MNWQKVKANKWTQKLIKVFNRGLTPWEMALSIMLGSFFGAIPLIGVATPAVTYLSIILRLNVPIALFMTYAVSPLHVLLFIPFIHLGEWILGFPQTSITFDAVTTAFKTDIIVALKDMALQLGCGLVGWILIGLPVAMILLFVLYSILRLAMPARKIK